MSTKSYLPGTFLQLSNPESIFLAVGKISLGNKQQLINNFWTCCTHGLSDSILNGKVRVLMGQVRARICQVRDNDVSIFLQPGLTNGGPFQFSFVGGRLQNKSYRSLIIFGDQFNTFKLKVFRTDEKVGPVGAVKICNRKPCLVRHFKAAVVDSLRWCPNCSNDTYIVCLCPRTEHLILVPLQCLRPIIGCHSNNRLVLTI